MLSILELTDIVNERGKYNDKDLRYNQWRRIYYGMSIHVDGVLPSFILPNGYPYHPMGWTHELISPYDEIFNLLLLAQYPNEAIETRNYRLSVYRPLTRAPFMQCIQVITGAIFQDSGYSITIEDKSDNDYIWGNNFDGKPLTQYISDSFPSIIEDPNGYFVTVPKVEDGRKVESEVWFVFSKQIIYKSDDEIVFINKDTKWVVNRVGYWRYRKSPNSNEWVLIEPDGYFAHMTGILPALVAGGVWNNQGYYSSWFENAKPVADEYAASYSTEQLVYRDASYPIIIEAQTDCAECNSVGTLQWCNKCQCETGVCSDVSEHEVYFGLKHCPSCQGHGKVQRAPGQRMLAPADMMDRDLVKYINPSTNINELHTKRNNEIYNQIFRALYMNYIEQAQSGVAKDKDMEARYQFMQRISNDLFDRLITGIIQFIMMLRNSRTENGITRPDAGNITIVKPTQFQVKTSYDLLEDFKMATEAKMPDYLRGAITNDYTDKQFGGNEVLKKKGEVIGLMDIMAVMITADIQVVLLNGGATQRDFQLHIQLPNLIDKEIALRGSDWFVNTPVATIIEILTAQFDKIKPATPILEDPTVVDRIDT